MAVYSVTMQNVTIVADATCVCIHTESTANAKGSNIRILRAWLSQIGTEVSDQLGVILGVKASAFGTFTAATPQPHWLGGGASLITGGTTGAESLAGTDASAEGAGTVTPIIYEGFNNIIGWTWVATEKEQLFVPDDTAIIVKIVGTPATLTGWSAGITYEELP